MVEGYFAKVYFCKLRGRGRSGRGVFCKSRCIFCKLRGKGRVMEGLDGGGVFCKNIFHKLRGRGM